MLNQLKNTYTHVHTYTDTYTHTHTHTYRLKHSRTYTHIHTHIQTHPNSHTHKLTYEGWNFNFGNATVTFDTAHLQSSYFHRPSMYSPKLCRARPQR